MPRTDDLPWRWYCRVCGAASEAEDEVARDSQAMDHLGVCTGGIRPNIGTATARRLLHVWTY